MAKKSMISKNEKRKEKIAKYGEKRRLLKERINDRSLSLEEKLELQYKLSRMVRDSSRIRYRNRCGLTGKPRGYYSHFRLCRNALRENISYCVIGGVTRSSW